MADAKRLIALTKKLISIDSQNPPGKEREIALFVKRYFEDLGLKVKAHAFKKDRLSVIARWEGSNKKNALLITPHLDTVPAGRQWRHDPFRPVICKDRLYGLGATDCKGNLACAMEAIKSMVYARKKLGYTLIFAATADEESGSGLGLIPLLDKGILAPQAAVVLDSDDFEIIVVQKGLLHVKIKIKGRQAHGAYPWQGSNAIDAAMAIIGELKAHRFVYTANKYLHPPTMNVGTIRGGDKVNVVADWCECELDFRFLPGSTQEQILEVVRAVARRHCRSFELEIEGAQKPYQIEQGHPLVACLKSAMKQADVNPVIKGSEGATVITFFQDKGIPAVATGFGSSGCAHIADEYVKVSNLYKGTRVLESFLTEFTYGD